MWKLIGISTFRCSRGCVRALWHLWNAALGAWRPLRSLQNPASVGNDVRGRADARISHWAEWVQACGGGSQSQRAVPRSHSEGLIGCVRMGKIRSRGSALSAVGIA